MKCIKQICSFFCGIVLLSTSIAAHAIIPSSITGVYTVGTPDNCPTTCTVQSGATLNITGAGTTATFSADITVMPTAKLVLNGATIKMATATRIILVQASNSVDSGAMLLINGANALITSVTNTPTVGTLWQGIECQGSAWASVHAGAFVGMNGGTIQYATCAYTHYDPVIGFQDGFGRLYAVNATFKNNIRCLDVGNTWYMPTPREDSIAWIGNYAKNCNFILTSDFPYTPPDMVNMYGAGLIMHSCSFMANNYYATIPANNSNNFNFVNNTTGINSQLSIIWVEKATGAANGSSFSNLKNGLVVQNQYLSYKTIFSNSYLYCINGVSIDGSYNPLIYGNISNGPTPINDQSVPFIYPPYCSFFLRNCPIYIMEKNEIIYDISSVQTGFSGIVVMNSGDADNEVYRNSINAGSVGITSIGTNRSSTGETGLKILCNTSVDREAGIIVMNDPSGTNPVNGVHNLQYVDLGNPANDRSAANIFSRSYTIPYYDVFLETGTNDPSLFLYKYDAANATYENPIYSTPFTIQTANTNTCPAHNTRSTQNTLPLWYIGAKGQTPRFNATFSREERDKQEGARPAKDEVSGLTPEQAENLSNMRSVQNWLAQNKFNWAALPQSQKQLVYDAEQNDAMYAGSIARGLLSRYEGKHYDPIVLFPPKPEGGIAKTNVTSKDKIYPNPTSEGKVWLDWQGGDAVLQISDLSGKTVWSSKVNSGVVSLDIHKLISGTYLAQIQQNGKVVYTQKLVKL